MGMGLWLLVCHVALLASSAAEARLGSDSAVWVTGGVRTDGVLGSELPPRPPSPGAPGPPSPGAPGPPSPRAPWPPSPTSPASAPPPAPDSPATAPPPSPEVLRPPPPPPSPPPPPYPPPPPSTPPPPSVQKNCTSLAEMAEGPFWLTEEIQRSDVRANLTYGVPLNITVRVVDGALSSNSSDSDCVAIEAARVDIWQCRYDGVYSDEEGDHTDGQTWLRGYQLTNSSGHVTFYSIFPGWYVSRTVHVHLRVRLLRDDGTYSYDDTTQLYFDDELTTALFRDVYPYDDRGDDVRDTYNYNDDLFSPTNLVTLAGSYNDSAGFSTSVDLSVPFPLASALRQPTPTHPPSHLIA